MRKPKLSKPKIILGIDEVGRGPWAGPLVIGAVILGQNHQDEQDSQKHQISKTDQADQNPDWSELTDSKKLTAKKRAKLNEYILQNAKATGLGWVAAKEIDKYGLSNSLKLASRRAVKEVLKQKIPFDEIIIDGTINFLSDTPLADRVTILKKADILIKEVSAASIIAKVARDNYMIQLAEQYPGYGFEKHVGYGTALHKTALLKLGPCPEHRRSFRPIQEIIANQEREVIYEQVDSAPHEAFEIAADSPALETSTGRGQTGENVILNHLIDLGHNIIAHNYKTPAYEIDLISTYEQNIYFTEVKYRKTSSHGSSLDQVTPRKFQQMQYAAEAFLAEHPEFSRYQPQLAIGTVSGASFNLEDWIVISGS